MNEIIVHTIFFVTVCDVEVLGLLILNAEKRYLLSKSVNLCPIQCLILPLKGELLLLYVTYRNSKQMYSY